jgi:hypothetical protein
VQGRYQARGWTEWTQGFQFGSALLQFDATGDARFLEIGRSRTVERMAAHLTHMGVHDHGFNNVSTYGNLWRLAREGRTNATDWERRFYELALKASGAVQARRWTTIADGGFIYSFNGAHSLFVDTIRSLRSLALGHVLGQRLMEEQDRSASLLERLVQHARATATFNVYFGRGPRPLRRPGPGRAREPLQRRQRHLSRPEHATGLLAVHDVDARDWRGRCSASPSSSNSSRRCRRGVRVVRRPAVDRRRCSSMPRARPAITISMSPPPTACPTGMRARRGWRRSTAGATVRPIRSTRSNRSTAPRRRLPRRVCFAWRASSSGEIQGDADRYRQAGLLVLDTLFDDPT